MPGKINSLSEEEQKSYLDNTYGISSIKLYEEIQHKCPLGEQVGVTKYEMTIHPGKKLAEFIALHWEIQEMMGQTFTLESGAAKVMEIVKKYYPDAKEIKVKASCPTNRHMAVDVEVEYKNESSTL